MVSQMPPDVMHLVDLGVTKAVISEFMNNNICENYYAEYFPRRNVAEFKRFIQRLSEEYAEYSQ